MIRFSKHITLADASKAARAIGCLLVPDMRGGAVIMTRSEALAEREMRQAMKGTMSEERHGNIGWVPVHHFYRLNGRDRPAPDSVDVE